MAQKKKSIKFTGQLTLINSNNMKRSKIRHNFEYYEFILWTSLPKELREPKTQAELSKRFGVGEDTLSEWKKRIDFWEEVAKKRKEWCKEKTSDVIHALYKRILETGSAAESKLWFQLIENWSERFISFKKEERPFEDLTDEELDKMLQECEASLNIKKNH